MSLSFPGKAHYAGDMPVPEAIRLIHHPRARRLRLKVDLVSGEVRLTAPACVSRAQAMAFLQANEIWVARQRARLQPVQPLAPGALLEIFGTPCRLVHVPGLRGSRLAAGELAVSGQAAFFSRRVLAAVRLQAQEVFQHWAEEFSTRLQLPAGRIRVRDTRSRWGSCTAQGGISLSWRLAFAPRDVARYVVAHEVAHRIEMNHSPAFWHVVNQLVGDVSSQRDWLVRQGHQLLRLGVAQVPPPGA